MVSRPFQAKTRSSAMGKMSSHEDIHTLHHSSFHGDSRKRRQSSLKITGGMIWAIIVGTIVLHSLVHVRDDYNYKMMQPAEQSKVLIIGAGAAGLTAAATLVDCKVEDIRILEASNDIGGRIKKSVDFADHAIDLGASFVYDPEWLEFITDTTNLNISTVPVDPSKRRHRDGYWLMKDYTWYDFFADHVAPRNPDLVVKNCQVEHIWHGNKGVQVSCGGRRFNAETAIVAVPLSVLKGGDITFHPPLDPQLVEQHPENMVPGVKVLLEFKWRFYPVCFEPKNSKHRHEFGWNEFYDFSASNSDSEKNILAADYVGSMAEKFANMSDEEIIQFVLEFLDGYMAEQYFVSENMASRNFIKGRIFNWSKEPYIRGATIRDFQCGDRCGAQDANGGKLFLAGEAFPYMINQREVGWVHNAAMSGKDAARQAMKQNMKRWKVSRKQYAIVSKAFAQLDAENAPSSSDD